MTHRRDVRMRPAVIADADLLLAWRNDPITRQVSLQTDEVQPLDHDRWLTRSLASQERVILIAEDAVTGAPLGMCRFDLIVARPASAEVSINIAPQERGGGVGRAVLVKGITAFGAIHPEVGVLTAVIRQANEASVRLFEAVDFRRVAEESGLLYYERNLAGAQQLP